MQPAILMTLTRGGQTLNHIGIPGGMGFGVGICPPQHLAAAPYLAELPGTRVIGHDQYGNYINDLNGSISCWVPVHYEKIGTGANGLDVNVIGIKSIYDFPSLAAANVAGYSLPRSMIDGGQIQPGFFYDKYKGSKVAHGTGWVAGSVQNGNPISAAADHNPIAGLTACSVNQYHEAINAAKARDGVNGAQAASPLWFPASRFQEATIAKLSLAHGQAALSTAHCAWYDPAANFPKGCNNNALRDINDLSVLYVSDGYSNCGKTGSGSPFVRTTHNGQACGIADVNGLLWEINLGITYNSTRAKFYIAKQSTRMRDFTAGNTLATDHWGLTGIDAMMEEVLIPEFGAVGWKYFGNGANQVLGAAVSGNAWLLAGAGIPQDANGQSAAGSALFGNDGLYWARANELCLLSGGTWNLGSYAGVWHVRWNNHRAYSSSYVGFRCAAYLS